MTTKRPTVAERKAAEVAERKRWHARPCVRGCGASVGPNGPLPTGWRVLRGGRTVICGGCDG